MYVSLTQLVNANSLDNNSILDVRLTDTKMMICSAQQNPFEVELQLL